jgi:hypothetical protein
LCRICRKILTGVGTVFNAEKSGSHL